MNDYNHPPYLRRLMKVLGAGVFALPLLGSSCPNSLPAATGDIEVTILRAAPTANSICPITQIIWQVTPVAVPPRSDGSSIGTTAVNSTVSVSGGMSSTSGGTTQFPIVCKHTQTFSPLAPGTWDVSGRGIRLTLGPAGNSPTCRKTVTAGNKVTATFVFNEGGLAESCS